MGHLLLIIAAVIVTLVALSAFGVIGSWALLTLIGLLAIAGACMIAAFLTG